MKDEIKEINIPDEVLIALEDLTNGALNYYKVIETVKVRHNIILDYITNLQERKITKEDVDKYFEENMCVSFDKFIENWNEQEELANYYKKENKRLKEEIENLTHIVANKIIEDYDIDTPLKNQLNEERIKYINLDVVCNDYKSRCEKSLKALHNSKEYKVMKKLESNKNMSILIKLDKLLSGDNNEK